MINCNYIILLLILTEARGIRLFHSSIPYKGLIYEDDDYPPECKNIDKYGQLKATSIITERCIIAYENENCEGHSFKVRPPGNEDLNRTLSSYHVCNETFGAGKVRVDLYSNETLLMRYKDLCGCELLPGSFHNPDHLNNYGNCIKLYEDPECQGKNKEVPAGKSEISDKLSLPFRAKAIGPCDARSCVTLTAEIFQFDINYEKSNEFEEEEFASKQTFYNNGSSTVVQDYKATKIFQETFGISKGNLSKAIVWLDPNLKIKSENFSSFSSVVEAFKRVYSRLGNYHAIDKTFDIHQSIQIPACEKYSISSKISYLETEIPYTVYAKITATIKGLPVPSEDLKNYVDLEFVEIIDNYTAVFKGSEVVNAKIALETKVNGEGSKIKSCKEELPSNLETRIMGGTRANPREFPSQVFIRIRSNEGTMHQCGGSILNPTHILTAAHCFSNPNYDVQEASVIAGVTNIASTRWRQTRQMSRYTVHPRFNRNTRYDNDIAVVVLKEPLTFNERVMATRLPMEKEEWMSDSQLTAVGWGSTSDGMESVANLMQVRLFVLEPDVCEENFGTKRVVTDNNICAEDSGKGTCQGDGGGLALCRRGRVSALDPPCVGSDTRCVQCGVISVGLRCSEYPSVFTKVSNYLSWIRMQMQNDPPTGEMDCPLKHKIMEEEWMKVFNRIFRIKKKEKASEEVEDRDHFGNVFRDIAD